VPEVQEESILAHRCRVANGRQIISGAESIDFIGFGRGGGNPRVASRDDENIDDFRRSRSESDQNSDQT